MPMMPLSSVLTVPSVASGRRSVSGTVSVPGMGAVVIGSVGAVVGTVVGAAVVGCVVGAAVVGTVVACGLRLLQPVNNTTDKTNANTVAQISFI